MIFITFWDVLMFYQIFLSPQVKRSAILYDEHDIYELPQKLPNDLRLRILGNQQIQENRETCSNYKLVPSLPAKMDIF